MLLILSLIVLIVDSQSLTACFCDTVRGYIPMCRLDCCRRVQACLHLRYYTIVPHPCDPYQHLGAPSHNGESTLFGEDLSHTAMSADDHLRLRTHGKNTRRGSTMTVALAVAVLPLAAVKCAVLMIAYGPPCVTVTG